MSLEHEARQAMASKDSEIYYRTLLGTLLPAAQLRAYDALPTEEEQIADRHKPVRRRIKNSHYTRPVKASEADNEL